MGDNVYIGVYEITHKTELTHFYQDNVQFPH